MRDFFAEVGAAVSVRMPLPTRDVVSHISTPRPRHTPATHVRDTPATRPRHVAMLLSGPHAAQPRDGWRVRHRVRGV